MEESSEPSEELGISIPNSKNFSSIDASAFSPLVIFPHLFAICWLSLLWITRSSFNLFNVLRYLSFNSAVSFFCFSAAFCCLSASFCLFSSSFCLFSSSFCVFSSAFYIFSSSITLFPSSVVLKLTTSATAGMLAMVSQISPIAFAAMAVSGS